MWDTRIWIAASKGIVRKPSSAANGNMELDSAPLLIFQADDILIDLGEPLTILFFQDSLQSATDSIVHIMYSRKSMPCRGHEQDSTPGPSSA